MSASGKLMGQLPAVYHSSADLRTLLAALEVILFEPHEQALEAQIGGIATLFGALETPDEFLPWLAQWVALSHANGLALEQHRRLVEKIVPLYAWRGTKRYLTELVKFYLPPGAEVRVDDQEFSGFRMGMAKVGVDTWLERDRPFWFKVTIRVPSTGTDAERGAQWQDESQKRIRQVIELAKPAHTTYDLDWALADEKSESFQV
ncbi:MAG TPA: phage tail protein [Candidatus Binatia bacterium]|jgi:phage tail-like protein